MGRKLIRTLVIAVAVGFTLLSSSVKASPYITLSVLGSTDGQNFSNNLSITPDETLYFEIVGAIAPVGTTNSNTVKSITSQSSSTDGLGSTKFNLNDSNATAISVASYSNLALQSGLAAGSGPSTGTVSGSNLTAIRPIGANGVFAFGTAASPFTVLTGQISLGSNLVANTPVTLDGAWYSGGAGSLKLNSGANTALLSNTSEVASGDPYEAYAPLTLTYNTPEPASLGLLGLGALALMRRRRTTLRSAVATA
jgi:hypothetical protein